ncbi:unnamed protein product, partial [Coregonus sp. 'balchen']
MAELEKEGLPQTMQENRDEEEPQYTDDSKPSKIQDDACFEEKLIEEVRRYTNLYNTSLKDYKDFTMTNNSWKEIAQTLRVEEQICRTKWKNLRDRYVRLRRKIKGKSGDAASGIQPQILTTLSWLSGFIKHKETESNYPKGFCFLGMGLAEHHMAVKHRLPLFLDLPPPALLSVLHFVQHVGTRGRTRQYVVGVGERLLVPDIIIILE